MELRQLETFYWIARLGSFAAAARKLHTTQPTVSMRIRELERDLDTELFDTSRRTARLTTKGRDLVEQAERIISMVASIRERMSSTDTLSGRVRVGVTETVALTWLPTFVSRMNERFPGVVLELDVDLTMNLWPKLESGSLEVMLLPGPILQHRLVSAYLGDCQYTWMASPRLGLPRGSLEPAALESVPILSLSSESTLHDRLESWFRSNGVQPRRIDVCNSLSVVASLTVAGLGVSLLPPEIFHREVSAGALRTLDLRPRLDALQFFVAYPEQPTSPLPAVIAAVAEEVSTFRRSRH